ncbi:MAG: hypothetical protein HC890_10420 [Chloroflexaceae bacterium]|nr:hypothetical protein [Chloroflexaceae bacterium]
MTNERAEILEPLDVFTLLDGKERETVGLPKTQRVDDLIDYVVARLTVHPEGKKIYQKGISVELLKPDAKGWRKGKLKLCIQFIPDEPESPLDDVRQAMKAED